MSKEIIKDKDKVKEASPISEIDKIQMQRKIDSFQKNISPMSSILRGALDSESRKLTDEESLANTLENRDSNLVIRDGRKRVKITDIISESLGQRYSDITRFNGYGFGTSSFLRQARINKFLEYNLPVLATSCGLMTDDIINGSNFGSEEKYETPFSFYKNGNSKVETDEEVAKMMKILEPDERDIVSQDVKSTLVLARDAIYNARRDGCSVIRIVPLSTIAKKMYIMWILKETKIKNEVKLFSKESLDDNEVKYRDALYPKDKESAGKINEFLKSIGLESLSLGTEHNIYSYLDESVINSIPRSLLREDKEIDLDNIISTEDRHDKMEYHHSESFQSFVRRYLSGDIKKFYSFENKYDVTVRGTNKNEQLVEKDIMGIHSTPTFTINVGGYNSNIDIGNLIEQINDNQDFKELFSLESLSDSSEDILSNLDDFDSTILKNTSFDEIYNIRLDNLLSKTDKVQSSYYSTEAMGNTAKKEKITSLMSPLERLSLKVINRLENKFYTSKVGSIEDVSSSHSTEANYNEDLIKGSSYGINGIEEITKRAEEKYAEYKKLDRLFGNIKGEYVEVVENTNLHYVMAGDRLMGVFQMEMSSEDLQNIIMARNMIYSGSLGSSMNFNNVNVDDIDLDQTMGRLMFTDYVKPILEKYMSKELIRSNVQIGHSLMKIMEENDMSNLARDSSELGSSIYNYTKVNFIPVEELIFFRNGTKGLGESLFKKAEIPAHMCILLREEYLGWIISDGKGVTFVTIPQGASDINGELGMSSIFDQIDEFMNLDRTSLRNTLSTNVGLTRKYFKVVKPDNSPDIKIDNIDMPDFPLNTDLILQLMQEATEQVGYNCSLFSSTDGNIELARKLYEMNGTKVLEIVSSQNLFRKSVSQLATLLLRLRGGEEYENTLVVWNPPLPSKINIDQRLNVLTSKSDLLNKVIDLIDSIFEKSPSIDNYDVIRSSLLLRITKDIFKNDAIFENIEAKIDEATMKTKTDLATKVVEK